MTTNNKSIRLKFIDPNSFVKKFRATIHKTGKLGFTTAAAKRIGLSKGAHVCIGVNEEDPKDKAFYIVRDNNSKEGFLVAKAGEYYYVNLRTFFDSLGINYKSGLITYDITEHDYNGKPMYKLMQRAGKQIQK